MSLPSDAQKFAVYYNQYLELMTETLNRRCERTLCFFQFLLGSAVFAQSSVGWLFGAVVATCAAFQYSWNPGKIASNAKKQAYRYQRLRDNFNKLTSESLADKMHVIEQNDSPLINSLLNPARCRAYIALGWPQVEKLTRWERIVAFLAGGIPQ
ncbi:hypothetical protein ZK99_004770 [Salmonella enterica subsp. enterica]|uniref:Uncharacterized protein n=1 Tax=Salmonella enterica subsp. enterica serovar Kottbus TaxID=224727 RepID=A0A5J0SB19_SALET|nr:hypothetical protein [Salmonella enterica subsp. enterica serovar Newport]EBQ9797406.1 hypothetical protein [Salmonella enterica subsp. enterica serovar Kottbus]ECA9706484.1 hypothetical protein [Salmonella enterica subsp. enterica serovar Bredeney]EDE8444750.1 hypothetical protein [Salmonella enterica subsp. enterica serovar Pomona]EDJ1502856.1 hypothetical protein [Salmonella enterica]EDN4396919.1 hypothetical protein [Salmonella enterica subsp. enterica]HCK3133603.1 hypothetical protein